MRLHDRLLDLALLAAALVGVNAQAQEAVRQMCEKLLANTVIENYAIELVE